MRFESGGVYEDWCYYLDPLGMCDEKVSDVAAAKKMARGLQSGYCLRTTSL